MSSPEVLPPDHLFPSEAQRSSKVATADFVVFAAVTLAVVLGIRALLV